MFEFLEKVSRVIGAMFLGFGGLYLFSVFAVFFVDKTIKKLNCTAEFLRFVGARAKQKEGGK